MWSSLKLKLEETAFFAGQLPAYTRHPKQFLFYLSAFLSSARSVTFHLQKRFAATGQAEYIQLRDEMLKDEIAAFFVNRRNANEKEGYPPIVVGQLVARRNPDTGQFTWTQCASTSAFTDDDGKFDLETLLRHDWDDHSVNAPARIDYCWEFPDFPGGPKEIVVACQEFSNRLWEFVYRFRDLWESEHDKGALGKRMAASMDRFLGLGAP